MVRFPVMMMAIRNAVLKRGVQHVFVVLLAIAVLAAGAGTGHAATQAGGQAHHAQAAAPDHRDDPSAEPAHQADCHGPAKTASSGKSPKNSTMHGCCASACFPSIPAQEFDHTAGLTFSVERLMPQSDQAIVVNALHGLFRPPRRHG